MSQKRGENVFFQAKNPYNPYNLKKNPYNPYNPYNFRAKKNKIRTIRTIRTFWPPCILLALGFTELFDLIQRDGI